MCLSSPSSQSPMGLTTVPFDVAAYTTYFLDDIVDVANLALVTDHKELIRCRVLPRINMVLSLFVSCPGDFLEKMGLWDCVVTGSCAVWVGLLQRSNNSPPTRVSQSTPMDGLNWRPQSLDLLVDDRHVEDICAYFRMHGCASITIEPFAVSTDRCNRYKRTCVHAVDSPWRKSSSVVTELLHCEDATQKRVRIIHLRPIPSALYIHLVSSPTSLDMTAFSSTTWLCLYPRLFQQRIVWFRELGEYTHYTSNIRWARFKHRGFRPTVTNLSSPTSCVGCPTLWRTLADSDSIGTCQYRLADFKRGGNMISQHTQQRFVSIRMCSLAWRFSERCLNSKCRESTKVLSGAPRNRFGVREMGQPQPRTRALTGNTEQYIDGMLFDTSDESLTVVPIPFLSKSNTSAAMDDLAINTLLDNIPHALYSPARYRFCVSADTRRNIRVIIIAIQDGDGQVGRLLTVKQQISTSRIVPCTNDDVEQYRGIVLYFISLYD
ncbi:hypothetical protein K435DRAFT_872530 [Dendrothele bispora CBS 962.96]|uniref:Uncharacterized protein n=1 Tax=Dendrothele bispora (strain CBS 962.96) TaxID=1314807 RepID=A0A4S8L1E0_DENBC|nr:hypothetical protein K435DRAFT_872530 [Dendrothele bispora CBS 962.96]